MRRWSVIGLALLFALVGAGAPLAGMVYLSWRLALYDQRAQLDAVAEQALAHALDVYVDAARTLRSISATDFEPCSPGHMRRLRELVVNSLAVDDLALVKDGILHCDVWGPAPWRLPLAPPDIVLPDGIGVAFGRLTPFSPDRPMLVLTLGDHRALVDQERFLHPPSAPSLRVELRAPGGHALRPLPATERAARIGDHSPGQQTARAEAQGWSVVVRERAPTFADQFGAMKFALLPVALFFALICILLVLWLSRRRMSPRNELELAIRNREFVAHYQPIVELATGRCVGAEALIRLVRPDGSLLRPDIFIPLAEDTGLIQPMTDLLLEKVVADLGELLRRDRRLHIAVNLCAADIVSGRILSVLERTLAGTGIEPQQIWVEATERSLMDIDGARRTLAELRRRGHMTAIDDFGTGYSGLTYLEKLPVDALKIDKSFIDSVGTEAPTRHVTDHIIALARELKLRIVAEGVQNEAQAVYLRRNKVEFAQGWLFARAQTGEEFIAYCAQNRATYGEPGQVGTLAAE
ncbi:EAL domain-containing protein [Ancylobacter sp. TS-1]|uniref:EAL domain-containing protein n=1 Tax=Ancylobacter sp. TS-1 TaxID=1850374 RepID=UPI001391A2AE|nr:EAL domain-containing protein [Ancylobacter sp. TS-1]